MVLVAGNAANAAKSVAVSGAARVQRRAMHVISPLKQKVEQFGKDVDTYLPADGKGVVFASAWLVTDNTFVALMKQERPAVFDGMHLVGVDTMHLFPEAVACAEEVQHKYGKKALIYTPLGVSNLAEFEAKFGNCEAIDYADFDFVSKVEPFQRALTELKKDVLVTGRRMDQGNQRVELAVFEEDKRVFNPLTAWSWGDVTSFVDYAGVPYNKAHHYVFRTQNEIPATERHLADLPWTKVDMGKPFWQVDEKELAADAPVWYVFKSFGDTHTSVPVHINESERAGRFVRQQKTECGIHTRTAVEGQPHGGKLQNLFVEEGLGKELVRECVKTIELDERQACDVWCLANGAFSPLTGFMDEKTYSSVVDQMRLPEKQLFGMPVTLDVAETEGISAGSKVLLRWQGQDVAVLEVSDAYKPNKVQEAKQCFGTSSAEHPGVYRLLAEQGEYYLGGKLHALENPKFPYPVQSPKEVRDTLPTEGKVVAFQNRNPIHRAHFELLKRAQADITGSTLLVHPTCGPTQPGDIDGLVRIDTYEALKEETKTEYPMFKWAYLPYQMKMAGPREAIMHMIIRKNFGATHFIIGRDMAGTKSTLDGEDFYGPYDAQETGEKYSSELGVGVVTYENMCYINDEIGYVPESEAKANNYKVTKLSGTKFRAMLRSGEDIPHWFSFKSVVDILRKAGDKAFCA